MISFSAPGKLFLLGEYAVLEGASALVAAVDRRAIVRAGPADAWELHTRPTFPENGDGMPGTAIFEAVRAAVGELGELPPLKVDIDTRAFFGPAGKLGLGASAAVAAALTGALAAAAGLKPSRAELRDLAIDAHRRAQGGNGSGADVAASIHGGVVAFSANREPESLDWPKDLHAAAVVTGTGADTRQLVGAVRALADTESYRRHMNSLTDLAERGRSAWIAGETGAFLEVADAYREVLSALGDTAGAGIVLPAHRRLAVSAANAGAVFKPSGAGGGDLGLLFADSVEALAKARAAAVDDGFDVPELGFGAPGLLE